MVELAQVPLAIIFIGSLAVFFLAIEAGHLIGSKVEKGANVATLEASVLGLLALIIGFTFSMALNRFEARREALVNEANAIETAVLRARLLPAPYGEESLELFKDYVRIRVSLAESEPNLDAAAQALRRSRELQETLWRKAQAAAAKDNAVVPTGLYIQALNETFNNQKKRLTIISNRVPNIVFVGLYCVAVAALWLTGYASALDRRRWRLPTYVACVLVAGVIFLIQDLDRPTEGFISISERPMLDTQQALERYLSQDASAPSLPGPLKPRR